MRITIAQLEAFFWVAHLGSVQRAARQLNLAQPTVSLRLRDLEAATRSKVLERAGRGVKLTQDGVALLEHANNIFKEIDRIRERLSGTEEARGIVRMGVPENFALVCLPLLMQTLAKDYSAVRLDLVVATSASLERDVAEGALDIAVVASPAGDVRLHQEPLGFQELTWAASPEWGLATTVRPVDIRHVPIITSPPPASLHRLVTGWFRTAGLEPLSLGICDSVTVIAQLVVNGVAIGLLPRKMIDPEVSSGRLISLACRPAIPKTPVFAVWRRTHETAAIRGVLRATRQALARIDLLEVP